MYVYIYIFLTYKNIYEINNLWKYLTILSIIYIKDLLLLLLYKFSLVVSCNYVNL